MKKIVFIGKTGSGKTTLIQKLIGQDLVYKKTQSMQYYSNILDTPGEYIENRNYLRALIVEAVNYEIIAFVQDSTDKECIFPPNFAYVFNKRKIGIITKIDLDVNNIENARLCLKRAGVNEIYVVSAYNNFGIEELKKLLD